MIVHTVTCSGWIEDMPIKLRYFMLAAYLASKSSKDSDKYTFGDKQRGRRKRLREGQDDSIPEGSLAGSSGVIVYSPQSFTLERALAIFIHIYSTHEEHRTSGARPAKMSFADKTAEEAHSMEATKKQPEHSAVYTRGGEGFFSMVRLYLFKFKETHQFS